MYIPIILGTAREGRQSEKVANYVLSEVIKYGLGSEILDVRDYMLKPFKKLRPTTPSRRIYGPGPAVRPARTA